MGVPLYVTSLFPLAAFKIISLTFHILIVMCLTVSLFRFILFGTLCFLDFESVSFARLEEFSAILSSNGFSDHFSLFYPSGTPITQMLAYLMLSQMSLKLFSFYFFFFLFAVPTRWFWLPYVPDCWSVLLRPLICCWFPLVYFSFQLLCSSVMLDSYLYFLSLCWSSHWLHPFFSWVWWANVWLLTWTLYLIHYLSSFV